MAHRGPAAAAGIQAAGSPAGTGCTREEVSVRYEQSQKLLKVKKKKREKKRKKEKKIAQGSGTVSHLLVRCISARILLESLLTVRRVRRLLRAARVIGLVLLLRLLAALVLLVKALLIVALGRGLEVLLASRASTSAGAIVIVLCGHC